jgi:hypothetical protein
MFQVLADTDVSLITGAITAAGAVVAAVAAGYTGLLAWPIARKVYRVAKGFISGM